MEDNKTNYKKHLKKHQKVNQELNERFMSSRCESETNPKSQLAYNYKIEEKVQSDFKMKEKEWKCKLNKKKNTDKNIYYTPNSCEFVTVENVPEILEDDLEDRSREEIYILKHGNFLETMSEKGMSDSSEKCQKEKTNSQEIGIQTELNTMDVSALREADENECVFPESDDEIDVSAPCDSDKNQQQDTHSKNPQVQATGVQQLSTEKYPTQIHDCGGSGDGGDEKKLSAYQKQIPEDKPNSGSSEEEFDENIEEDKDTGDEKFDFVGEDINSASPTKSGTDRSISSNSQDESGYSSTLSPTSPENSRNKLFSGQADVSVQMEKGISWPAKHEATLSRPMLSLNRVLGEKDTVEPKLNSLCIVERSLTSSDESSSVAMETGQAVSKVNTHSSIAYGIPENNDEVTEIEHNLADNMKALNLTEREAQSEAVGGDPSDPQFASLTLQVSSLGQPRPIASSTEGLFYLSKQTNCDQMFSEGQVGNSRLQFCFIENDQGNHGGCYTVVEGVDQPEQSSSSDSESKDEPCRSSIVHSDTSQTHGATPNGARGGARPKRPINRPRRDSSPYQSFLLQESDWSGVRYGNYTELHELANKVADDYPFVDIPVGIILKEMRRKLRIKCNQYLSGYEWVEAQSLGSGAYGTVHMGVDRETYAKFAVKKCKMKFMKQEIQNLILVQTGPQVVRLYGMIATPDTIYIFMEFLEGPSLGEWIHTNPSPDLYIALFIIKQVLQILIFLKKKNMLHDDIKSDNFVFRSKIGNYDSGECPPYEVCLVDFGMSHLNPPKTELQGTMLFNSPEKMASQGHSYPAEVFASMITFMHMALQEIPNSEMTHYQLLFYRGEGNVPSFNPPGVAVIIREFVNLGLHANPAVRKSAEALLCHPVFQLLETRDPSDAIFNLPQRPSAELLQIRQVYHAPDFDAILRPDSDAEDEDNCDKYEESRCVLPAVPPTPPIALHPPVQEAENAQGLFLNYNSVPNTNLDVIGTDEFWANVIPKK